MAAHPVSTVALTLLGMALCGRGDPDGAIAAYREAIRLDATDAVAHSNLGVALVRKKNLDEAIPAPARRARLKREEEVFPDESPEERDNRLGIERLRAEHEIWKERWIVGAFVTAMAAILVMAVGVIILSNDTTTRNWATGALSSGRELTK